jgi:RNA polymerase sigma-70 factor (sigma-E family)
MERMRGTRTREEFERFVAASSDHLLRTGYLLVWDLAEAEDLVQETLIRVARRWPRVRSMDHPNAYARRILVNLALDDRKRRFRRRRELEPAGGRPLDDRPDAGSARELGTIDARAELTAALAALTPRQRAVLVLRYFEDLSEAQVAEVLGCSLGTVKSTASRGLARLQQDLGSTDPTRSATTACAHTPAPESRSLFTVPPHEGVTHGQPTRS